MERDERLLPLPNINDLEPTTGDPEYPTSYSPPYDDAFNDNRSIQEYLHVVYKRLPLILALTILATAATAFYMYRLPSRYSASTSMIIEPRKRKAMETVNINFGNDFKYYNTQLRLLNNRDLMYDVVVQKGLYKNPNLFKNQRKGILTTLRSMFSGAGAKADDADSLQVTNESGLNPNNGEEVVLSKEDKKRAEMYSSFLLGGVTVNQVDRTNLVTITVRNTNPALTAVVANGIAEVFMEQDVKRETAKARGVLTELTNSINKLKVTLADQDQELVGFMRQSDLSVLGENGSALTSGRLSTISGQWLTAMDERRKIEANYATALKSKNLGALPQDLVNNQSMQDARKMYLEERSRLRERLRDLDKQINEAETARKELLVRYTEEYVEVKKAAKKIETLRAARDKTEKEGFSRIDRENTNIQKTAKVDVLSGLRAQLSAAQNREGKLRSEYLKEVSKANFQGQAERRLTTLKREIETKRKLYDQLIQRQKQQELAIASSQPDNIKISARAVTPSGPIGPERNRNIVLAFLVSLLGGAGLAFLLDYLDDSIRTSDDIGRNLGLPTLALIPYQEAVSQKQIASISEDEVDGDVHSLALIALRDTRSPVAEAYRHLRTSLLFSSAGNPPQTILVTSSQPSEGKTTTAINTAIALAQSDAEVVIIDCDLRRPRLHSHFNMHNSHGLTNYLSGEKDTDKLLKPVPDLPNLKLITSGPIPPNPAELLSSNEMKNLLQFLKGNYQHVILDSPPAISFTDSAILSTLVDGVVLVAKAGSSSIHLMKRFKQRLSGLGTRIYGVVLNGVKPNSLEYGYYGYDYNYDYYTNSDESTPLLEDDADHVLDEDYVEGEDETTDDQRIG